MVLGVFNAAEKFKKAVSATKPMREPKKTVGGQVGNDLAYAQLSHHVCF